MNEISDFLTWAGTDTIIKIIGLLGIIVTSWFAYKRAKSMEKQISATQEQLLLSKKSQITEQFNKAIEQLAHEKKEVRIGGLYTLNRLKMQKNYCGSWKTFMVLITQILTMHTIIWGQLTIR